MASAREQRAAGWRLFRAALPEFITPRRSLILGGTVAAAAGLGVAAGVGLMSGDAEAPLVTAGLLFSSAAFVALVAALICVIIWSRRDRPGVAPSRFFTDTVTKEIARARKAGETPAIPPKDAERLAAGERYSLHTLTPGILMNLVVVSLFAPMFLATVVAGGNYVWFMCAAYSVLYLSIAAGHIRQLGILGALYPDELEPVTASTPNDREPETNR